MEIFYATVVACWIGVGCFFGQWPQTYNEATCGVADTGLYEELSKSMGQPNKWEFACVDEEGLDALVEEYGVTKEDR